MKPFEVVTARGAARVLLAIAMGISVFACHSPAGPGGTAILLSANVVDPATVNAVSQFDSCVGHAFPQPNSPNSGKNYFWPTSLNFNSTDQLRLYAACDGTTGQNNDDTNDTSAIAASRGPMIHLFCDGSSTSLRYFHINMPPGTLGQHVRAGDFLGYAVLLGIGQNPAATWQFSGTFDIAVVEGDDSITVNYFAKLNASAFAAWAARGVTSVAQTLNPGNPTCPDFSSNIGHHDVVSFTPLF